MRERVVKGKQTALLRSSFDAVLTPKFLVEYLEGELDANLDDDLELLLMNSVADRRALKSLESTKEILKAADDIYLPEDGHYYDRMHASIMLAIAEESNELVDGSKKENNADTIRQRL